MKGEMTFAQGSPGVFERKSKKKVRKSGLERTETELTNVWKAENGEGLCGKVRGLGLHLKCSCAAFRQILV